MKCKHLCGEFWRHDMAVTPGGWKSCSRCGTLARFGVPVEARFWHKVRKTPTCWIWTGCVIRAGYGEFAINGKAYRSNRLAYYFTHGDSKTWKLKKELGKVIMHTCDNKLCVNPAHLVCSTQRENMLDMIRKGRKPGATVTPDQVREIRKLAKTGLLNHEIASRMNTKVHSVCGIVAGRTWGAVI